MAALLDVNVLIALLDAGHVHHRSATRWLGEHLHGGMRVVRDRGCKLTLE